MRVPVLMQLAHCCYGVVHGSTAAVHGSVVLLERKGVSGWIIKCSLVKSDGIPQGTYVRACAYSMRVQGMV